jgi:two-component system, response regulator / RNA-binding antiterminator
VHKTKGALTALTEQVRVVVIDDNPVRSAILEGGLRDAGYTAVFVVDEMHGLLKRIVDLDPDILIIDLENPSRDVLEQMFQVSRAVRRPVAMFVDESDRSMIEAAIDAGVSAYVVDGLKRERVRAIVDMAISRFGAFARLQDELHKAKSDLEDRKIIERAKGLLMQQRGLDEAEAYAALRRTAMNSNSRLVDVCQSLLLTASLFTNGGKHG